MFAPAPLDAVEKEEEDDHVPPLPYIPTPSPFLNPSPDASPLLPPILPTLPPPPVIPAFPPSSLSSFSLSTLSPHKPHKPSKPSKHSPSPLRRPPRPSPSKDEKSTPPSSPSVISLSSTPSDDDEDRFTCVFDELVFVSVRAFSQHLLKVHQMSMAQYRGARDRRGDKKPRGGGRGGADGERDRTKNEHRCALCDKVYTTLSRLNDHYLQHELVFQEEDKRKQKLKKSSTSTSTSSTPSRSSTSSSPPPRILRVTHLPLPPLPSLPSTSSDDDDSVCGICLSGDSTDENPILLCDGECGMGYHQECIGADYIPEGDWWCSEECERGQGMDVAEFIRGRREEFEKRQRDRMGAGGGGREGVDPAVLALKAFWEEVEGFFDFRGLLEGKGGLEEEAVDEEVMRGVERGRYWRDAWADEDREEEEGRRGRRKTEEIVWRAEDDEDEEEEDEEVVEEVDDRDEADMTREELTEKRRKAKLRKALSYEHSSDRAKLKRKKKKKNQEPQLRLSLIAQLTAVEGRVSPVLSPLSSPPLLSSLSSDVPSSPLVIEDQDDKEEKEPPSRALSSPVPMTITVDPSDSPHPPNRSLSEGHALSSSSPSPSPSPLTVPSSSPHGKQPRSVSSSYPPSPRSLKAPRHPTPHGKSPHPLGKTPPPHPSPSTKQPHPSPPSLSSSDDLQDPITAPPPPFFSLRLLESSYMKEIGFRVKGREEGGWVLPGFVYDVHTQTIEGGEEDERKEGVRLGMELVSLAPHQPAAMRGKPVEEPVELMPEKEEREVKELPRTSSSSGRPLRLTAKKQASLDSFLVAPTPPAPAPLIELLSSVDTDEVANELWLCQLQYHAQLVANNHTRATLRSATQHFLTSFLTHHHLPPCSTDSSLLRLVYDERKKDRSWLDLYAENYLPTKVWKKYLEGVEEEEEKGREGVDEDDEEEEMRREHRKLRKSERIVGRVLNEMVGKIERGERRRLKVDREVERKGRREEREMKVERRRDDEVTKKVKNCLDWMIGKIEKKEEKRRKRAEMKKMTEEEQKREKEKAKEKRRERRRRRKAKKRERRRKAKEKEERRMRKIKKRKEKEKKRRRKERMRAKEKAAEREKEKRRRHRQKRKKREVSSTSDSSSSEEEEEESEESERSVSSASDSEQSEAPSTASSSSDEGEGVPLYCTCRTPFQEGQFMIECDVCQEWYHGKCVNLTSTEGDNIEQYVCAKCEEATGRRTTWHRREEEVERMGVRMRRTDDGWEVTRNEGMEVLEREEDEMMAGLKIRRVSSLKMKLHKVKGEEWVRRGREQWRVERVVGKNVYWTGDKGNDYFFITKCGSDDKRWKEAPGRETVYAMEGQWMMERKEETEGDRTMAVEGEVEEMKEGESEQVKDEHEEEVRIMQPARRGRPRKRGRGRRVKVEVTEEGVDSEVTAEPENHPVVVVRTRRPRAPPRPRRSEAARLAEMLQGWNGKGEDEEDESGGEERVEEEEEEAQPMELDDVDSVKEESPSPSSTRRSPRTAAAAVQHENEEQDEREEEEIDRDEMEEEEQEYEQEVEEDDVPQPSSNRRSSRRLSAVKEKEEAQRQHDQHPRRASLRSRAPTVMKTDQEEEKENEAQQQEEEDEEMNEDDGEDEQHEQVQEEEAEEEPTSSSRFPRRSSRSQASAVVPSLPSPPSRRAHLRRGSSPPTVPSSPLNSSPLQSNLNGSTRKRRQSSHPPSPIDPTFTADDASLPPLSNGTSTSPSSLSSPLPPKAKKQRRSQDLSLIDDVQVFPTRSRKASSVTNDHEKERADGPIKGGKQKTLLSYFH